MTNGQGPRRSGDMLVPTDLTGEQVSAGAAVDEAIGSHPDPLAPGQHRVAGDCRR